MVITISYYVEWGTGQCAFASVLLFFGHLNMYCYDYGIWFWILLSCCLLQLDLLFEEKKSHFRMDACRWRQ